MNKPLDDRRFKILKRWFEEGIPFNVSLGLRVESLHEGVAVLRLPYQPTLIGDTGRPALHGGVISMLADTAGGAACSTMLRSADDRLSTVDLRVDYLRPGLPKDVLCRAEVLRMGNRVAVASMSVFSGNVPHDAEPSSPIAMAHAVYNVVRRSDASA